MNNLQQFFEDAKVPYIMKGPQVTKGWLGVNCPFCGDTDFHMGYNMKFNIFSCWRCGVKPFKKTLQLLTGIPYNELDKSLATYYVAPTEEEDEVLIRPENCDLPVGAGLLQNRHKRYLRQRGLDPLETEKIWGLKGTLDEGDFANRIIIPIYYRNKLCSYTSRDITDRQKLKALTCPREKESIHCKHLLHGFDLVKGNSVVVMEGPFDVFKYGAGAIDTLGIKFTAHQVDLLGCFKNIFIVFDSIINDYGREEEKQAQQQAELLADTLSIRCNVWVIDEFQSDPGTMTANQIKRLRHNIQKTIKNIKEETNV